MNSILEKKWEGKSPSETDKVADELEVAMLCEKLVEMGFSPDLDGCINLVSCIPRSTRSLYPENPVDAAIKYFANNSV